MVLPQWPPQQSIVRTGEVNDLEVENLISKVGRVPEHDGEPDASERSSLDSGDDPKEGGPTRVKVLPRDPHEVKGVGIENVEAAPTIHQHHCEAHPFDDGANDEREMAQARDMLGEVLVTEGDGHL